MNPLPINIIGAGSMGNLWSAYLLRQKFNLNLFAKCPQAQQNYQLKSPDQCFSYCIDHKTLTEWQTPSFIIICVKTTAIEKLCRQLKDITSRHAPILLMMNGMGIIEIVKRYLPDTKVYQASTNHGARLENSTLYHTGSGETAIGSISTQNSLVNDQKAIAPLLLQLNQALPISLWNPYYSNALWSKLLVNAIINPLTAIHNVENGAITDNKQINQQAKELTQQLTPLIEKYLPDESWQSIFKKVERVANQTYTNVSSMRQDILLGRKTEIDFISGYLLKIAKQQNMELPEHEKVMNQIKILEKSK